MIALGGRDQQMVVLKRLEYQLPPIGLIRSKTTAPSQLPKRIAFTPGNSETKTVRSNEFLKHRPLPLLAIAIPNHRTTSLGDRMRPGNIRDQALD